MMLLIFSRKNLRFSMKKLRTQEFHVPLLYVRPKYNFESLTHNTSTDASQYHHAISSYESKTFDIAK